MTTALAALRRAGRRWRRAAIPLADLATFRRDARVLGITRLVLAASLVGLLALAFALARGLQEPRTGLLSPGTSGVVALDVSGSIDPTLFGPIHETLRRLAESNGRYGLVLFSDTGYEALPPGTKAAELKRYLRFFAPGGLAQARPVSPWMQFSGGTQISTGLELARSMLERDGASRRAVVLISDLLNSTADTAALTESLFAYRREGIDLHVVGLSPESSMKAMFTRILGDAFTAIEPKAVPEPRGRTFHGPFPLLLTLVGVALIVLVALNEHRCARLSWAAARRERESAA